MDEEITKIKRSKKINLSVDISSSDDKYHKLYNEIPFDHTFSPIPFNSNEPFAISDSEYSRPQSAQYEQSVIEQTPKNISEISTFPKSFSDSDLPEVAENMKPSELLLVSPYIVH